MPAAAKNATDGLKLLREARISVQRVHRDLEDRQASLATQISHLEVLVLRFILRRDQLLASAEAHPNQSAQTTELVRTAERLRGNVQRSLDGLIGPHKAAVADERKAQTALNRIDTATERLEVAAENLRLVQLEEQSRRKLADLERSSRDQLHQIGKPKKGAATYVPRPALNAASTELEMHLRDVTRLTYESEALVELQRERLT